MNSLNKAIAEAREALREADNAEGGPPYERAAMRCHHAIHDLLAAIDAAREDAVAWCYRRSKDQEWSRPEWTRGALVVDGDEWMPLFAAPPEAAATHEPIKPITEHLCDMLRERSRRGLAKYGTTVDRSDLSKGEWLQHLLEELLDAAQYVEAAKRSVKLSGARKE